MGIAVIVVLLILISMQILSLGEAGQHHTTFVKRCPPHEWQSEPVTDQHGAQLGERLVCKTCRCFPGQSKKETR